MIRSYRPQFQERWKQHCIIPSPHYKKSSISTWLRNHHLTCARCREYSISFPLCKTVGVL